MWPSILTGYNNGEVRQAAQEVQGALQIAQRQAITIGTGCSLTLNTNSITTANARCLLGETTRELPEGVTLSTNITSTLDYSVRGNVATTPAPPGVIVLYRADNNDATQRCIIIQNSLGAIQTGTYSGNDPTTPTVSDCTPGD